MLDILKAVRYAVFVIFVICNAVITSVAVWNLSIVQALALDATSKRVDAFLIFVGVSGLILVFPILFLELFGKETFFSKVWFELAWVAVFWVLELVSAATITSQSNSQLCDAQLADTTLHHESPCTSAQVLQAFTWICAIILFGYLSLLSITTVLRYRNDHGIFHCSVRKFPWAVGGLRQLNSTPQSPSKDKFHQHKDSDEQDGPHIAAPRPHRLTIPFGEAFVSRGIISQNYDIESFKFPARDVDDSHTRMTGNAGPSAFAPHVGQVERHQPLWAPAAASTEAGPSDYLPAGTETQRESSVPEQPAVMRTLAPVRTATALYPSYVQNVTSSKPPVAVLGTPSSTSVTTSAPVQPPPPPVPVVTIPKPAARKPTATTAATLAAAAAGASSRPPVIALVPSAPPQPPAPVSPSPLGDWPRLDAVNRPVTSSKAGKAPLKRKPLPLPSNAANNTSNNVVVNNGTTGPREAQPPKPPPPTSYAFDPAALTAALKPLASPAQVQGPQTRTSLARPSGPRIRSSVSGDNYTVNTAHASALLQPQRRPPNLDLSNISNHQHRSSNMS